LTEVRHHLRKLPPGTQRAPTRDILPGTRDAWGMLTFSSRRSVAHWSVHAVRELLSQGDNNLVQTNLRFDTQ